MYVISKYKYIYYTNRSLCYIIAYMCGVKAFFTFYSLSYFGHVATFSITFYSDKFSSEEPYVIIYSKRNKKKCFF